MDKTIALCLSASYTLVGGLFACIPNVYFRGKPDYQVQPGSRLSVILSVSPAGSTTWSSKNLSHNYWPSEPR